MVNVKDCREIHLNRCATCESTAKFWAVDIEFDGLNWLSPVSSLVVGDYSRRIEPNLALAKLHVNPVDTRYGNTFYSTEFHCMRFQLAESPSSIGLTGHGRSL